MQLEDINICLACDNNYAKYAGVVITSILKNLNPNKNVKFFILHDNLAEDVIYKFDLLKHIYPCSIEFIKINNDMYQDYMNIKTNKYLSIATYYRLKIASLLLNIDKVLYLDCDIVVNDDISKLYQINIDNYVLAGVEDICAKFNGYINAGVIIFNLKKMREDGIEECLLSWTRENAANIGCGDQDIINFACKDNILVINDKSWNVQSSEFYKRSVYTKNPKLIHYIGKYKPWLKYSLCYYKDFYIKYLQMSPWAMSSKDYALYKLFDEPISLIRYIRHRPFIFFTKNFYKAIIKSYFMAD